MLCALLALSPRRPRLRPAAVLRRLPRASPRAGRRRAGPTTPQDVRADTGSARRTTRPARTARRRPRAERRAGRDRPGLPRVRRHRPVGPRRRARRRGRRAHALEGVRAGRRPGRLRHRPARAGRARSRRSARPAASPASRMPLAAAGAATARRDARGRRRRPGRARAAAPGAGAPSGWRIHRVAHELPVLRSGRAARRRGRRGCWRRGSWCARSTRCPTACASRVGSRPADNDLVLETLGRCRRPAGAAGAGGRRPHRHGRARAPRETRIEVEWSLDGSGASAHHDRHRLPRPHADRARLPLAHRPAPDAARATCGWTSTTPSRTSRSRSARRSTAALGDRAGIVRFGDARAPLDEALCHATVDLGGRGYASVTSCRCGAPPVGGLPTSLSPTSSTRSRGPAGWRSTWTARGEDDHHVVEAAFKALALALRAGRRRRPAPGRRRCPARRARCEPR